MAVSARTSEPARTGEQRYIVALGSNRRHYRHGGPRRVLRAAVAAMEEAGLTVESSAPVVTTPPLGHARRRYANGAAVVVTKLKPDALLAALKGIEHAFGRRKRGRPWGDRVLDLDILLWSGGPWVSTDLVVPHVAFRRRRFALAPAAALMPRWRDPLTGLTLNHLLARLTRRDALPIGHTRSGP